MQEEKEKRADVLVSAVLPNNIMVETVRNVPGGETAFLVCRDGSIKRQATFEHEGKHFRPIRPTNNLLKHDAIRFASEATTHGDAASLLGDIERYLAAYVSLEPDARRLAAAYVLLTWVYDAFRELPYLRFRGDYGTGKTRALLVVGSVTYKPFFASGASTVSPIFHTLDTFRGTLIFDEADFRFSDEKAELVKILNNGNAKGFPVLRTRVTERREFDPQAFVVYGPKIVGMRHTYEDRALESRFLSIDMLPGRRNEVPLNLPLSQEEDALELRNKLLGYRLRERSRVTLDASLADPLLEARTNQILLPLLSVVPDEEVRRSVRTIAGARETTMRADRGFSTEGRLVALLADQATDRLPLREIASAFSEAHGPDYDRPITSRSIGTILRRLGFHLYKSDGVYVLAPGQQSLIAALAARYGVGGDSAGKDAQRDSSGT
ncbi:MAG: hypothetical protein GEV13_00840 [Rhodospirillales bacterium]|nr:hypothetical protein [Rhodospirillales bacterium]